MFRISRAIILVIAVIGMFGLVLATFGRMNYNRGYHEGIKDGYDHRSVEDALSCSPDGIFFYKGIPFDCKRRK